MFTETAYEAFMKGYHINMNIYIYTERDAVGPPFFRRWDFFMFLGVAMHPDGFRGS